MNDKLEFRRKFLAGAASIGIAGATAALPYKVEAATTQSSHKNILNFGADPSGTNDSTTAIMAAINGSSNIFAPSGTYLVSTLRIPSGVELFGDGISTVFKMKAGTNAPLFEDAESATAVYLHDFKIAGNSAGNTSSGKTIGVHISTAASLWTLSRIWVDDIQDWGLNLCGKDIRANSCRVTNVVGGSGRNAVRAGIICGAGGVGSTRVTLSDCQVDSCSVTYTDGIIIEDGSVGIIVSKCRVISVPYSGIKINGITDQTIIEGCLVEGTGVGYQVQGASTNLLMTGNIACRNQGSGFFFDNVYTNSVARNWIISNNIAVENGQNTAWSTRYGFAFENRVSCTTDGVLINGNTAVDNQPQPTQTIGICFGSIGTFKNVALSNNYCKGNINSDFDINESLGTYEVYKQGNIGFVGSSSFFAQDPLSVRRMDFWANDVAAYSGNVVMSDGVGGRGYIVARAGWLRTITAVIDPAMTTGSITFTALRNGNRFGPSPILTAGPNATFATRQQNFPGLPVAPGDKIQCSYVATSGFLPTRTANINVVIEIVE